MAKMNVVVIKYNAGNIYSVDYALRRLGVVPAVTSDPERIASADKIIFPGVGEASTAMAYLKAHGMADLIRGLKQPVLGICLGMQLLCRFSEEGNTGGLGIFDVDVRRFAPRRCEDKVPHMGWNTIGGLKGPLFAPPPENRFVYFVHSYYVPLNDATTATAEHILPFSAALQKGNFLATQFHPEKSGEAGERILKNFLNM